MTREAMDLLETRERVDLDAMKTVQKRFALRYMFHEAKFWEQAIETSRALRDFARLTRLRNGI